MGPLIMTEKLTDRTVRTLTPPAIGNRIHYDTEVAGFGIRITAAGAKSFVLNYRAGGRERRITIGSFPDWTVQAAREEAKALKRRVDIGEDPMEIVMRIGPRQLSTTWPTDLRLSTSPSGGRPRSWITAASFASTSALIWAPPRLPISGTQTSNGCTAG